MLIFWSFMFIFLSFIFIFLNIYICWSRIKRNHLKQNCRNINMLKSDEAKSWIFTKNYWHDASGRTRDVAKVEIHQRMGSRQAATVYTSLWIFTLLLIWMCLKASQYGKRVVAFNRNQLMQRVWTTSKTTKY